MKRISWLLAVGAVYYFAGSFSQVFAQTREKGPWWPHPIWGPHDEAASSNWITPAKVLESIRLVRTGQIYELGHIYERGMPLYGQRTYAMTIPGSPSSGPVGRNRLVSHDEFLCAEIGQVGTQFDGPGHIGQRLMMADGTWKDVFYNGVPIEEMRDRNELRKLGIHNVKPYLTRGVLVDIAGYKNVATLPNSYEVSVADIRGALSREGISEASIKPGDALLFRYGWSKLWKEPAKYNERPPGIGLEVARWLVEKQPSLIGSDSWCTEVIPNPDPDLAFPVHAELIPKNGILNLENMVFDDVIQDGGYEFLFVLLPVRYKGASGAPSRPIAVR